MQFHTRIPIIMALCCLCCSPIFAQEGPPITVIAQAEGTQIHLRWSVADADTWLAANANGYRIARMTVSQNGVRLNTTDQVASRTLLDTLYQARAENTWPADDRSQAAKQILYSSDWDVAADGTLAAAVSSQENRENRLFFAHVLADQDFALAKDFALGFTDQTAVNGETYVYIITVKNYGIAGRGVSGSVTVAVGADAGALVAVQDVSVRDGDTSVAVGWRIRATEHLYVNYDIFRAPSGSTAFVKVNEAPFIYGYEGDHDPGYAWFTDSVAVYGSYDYYVVGNTPFGLQGPPSAIATGSSRPDRLPLIMRLDSIYADESSVTLLWPTVPNDYTAFMVAQRVYRAASIKGSYELVSPNSLSPATRSWIDTDPLGSGYYYVELEDANGHLYQSPPQLGQLEDRTPPATPSGFTGEDRGDGSVILNWDTNTEADLKGYRLLRCYARGGNFATVSVDALTETAWTDDLTGTVINDSIFYRLLALDQRANASPKTPVLAIARVDITPPAKPVLARVDPTPQGVALSWEYSGDEDIVRHELQRRAVGTPEWVIVATVLVGTEDQFVVSNFNIEGDINYLDDSDLQRRAYDYQFLAFDDADLGAGSDIVTIRPYDSGERGEIQDIAISFVCQDSTIKTDLDEVTTSIMDNLIALEAEGNSINQEKRQEILFALEMNNLLTSTQFNEWFNLTDAQFAQRLKDLRGTAGPRTKLTDCGVELQWSYPLEAGILHFQLYRSRRGSRLRPYKALPVDYFFDGPTPSGRQLLTYEDTDVDAGVRYVYKVGVVYMDGGYAQESRGVTVVVE